MIKKLVMLCILDGWGLKNGSSGDTLSIAKTPVFNKLWQTMPKTTLKASGEAVGLPPGLMGNSEVGHLNIGAGRIVYQDLTKITKAIENGDFFSNPRLLHVMEAAKTSGGKLHLMGLFSDGGVHSSMAHLKALVEIAKSMGVPQLYIHCFLDGRDVPPTSGINYMKEFNAYLEKIQYGKIGTIMGRFYAMDRDKRWDRIEKAWRALVLGEGKHFFDPIEAVRQSYQNGVTDEFMEPVVITEADGRFYRNISQGDSVIFYNFRADRAREITRALTDGGFDEFERPRVPMVEYCCMTRYDETFPLPVAFPKEEIPHTFGQELAAAGKNQFRIAETEKYAHVTFFFNGGVEEPNPGEDRLLVPSPKVATYDLQPEMSAEQVTIEVLTRIKQNKYDAIILNFANPDMVGHTGMLPAAIKAVEKVDKCLGKIVKAIQEVDGVLLVTADHGNVEKMMDDKGNPVTSHTTSDVPCILIGVDQAVLRTGGSLQDIAPTLLHLLGLPKPQEMTGNNLIEE